MFQAVQERLLRRGSGGWAKTSMSTALDGEPQQFAPGRPSLPKALQLTNGRIIPQKSERQIGTSRLDHPASFAGARSVCKGSKARYEMAPLARRK